MSYHDGHDKSGTDFGNISTPQDRNKHVDVREELKRELYNQANLPNPSQGRLVGTFPPGASGSAGVPPPLATLIPFGGPGQDGQGGNVDRGVIDRFFYMDSDARDSSSDLSTGRLIFNIQTLNQAKPVENIIEMQIGDFFFPEIETAASAPTYYFFRRIYVLIEEIQAQSVLAQDSNRFHFALGVQPSGISNSTVDVGFNKFIFARPLRDISTATFRFTKPPQFANVVFPQDIFDFTVVPGAPGGPTFGGGEIVTSLPHGIAAGTDVSIFISNFNSSTSIDADLNSSEGHLVRAVDTTTFEFRAAVDTGFDFTTITTAVPGSLLIGFRRTAFTMRFRSISDGRTNDIVAV